ncbi:vanadium-dependent haloperoxidase [Planosporangium sp. 12N6]|uniref:vanadium-dependent haloperoxidase n=1 Tax=Planosporangium spinosum TaxID=3402278 RepID=UPI003CF12714
MSDRKVHARDLRVRAAEAEFARPGPDHLGNGEETDYPYVASYAKGLPHNEFGEVDPDAYRLLLRACATGRAADFERIPLAGPRPLTNPQAGLGFDLEGPDPAALTIPPAPRIDSAQNSSEMVELYWMALCRDVPFTSFDTDPLIAEAAGELSGLSDFRGPTRDGAITADTLFRGTTRGDLRGPFLSQFLLRDIPYGTLLISQRQDTLHHRHPRPVDYLTTFKAWHAVQNGAQPAPPERDHGDRRYIRTPRDLAHYVHFDALYEAYLNAALILLGLGAPADPGNPYHFSRNQAGFGTYGSPHLLSLVTEVATRALKAAWYQKWYVHRRLRPEEFGGRVHLHMTGKRDYPMIDSEVLDSAAVKRTFARHGSYLLPQAFPEGSPTHPAYGSGHATVAGACVTVLKAWFDESYVLADPVVPAKSGTTLVPYVGPDAEQLTVGGELNKLAANIATGRNMGGVHWRTDFTAAVRLGEEVAIGILRELVRTTHEEASFSFGRFDGTTMTIAPNL